MIKSSRAPSSLEHAVLVLERATGRNRSDSSWTGAEIRACCRLAAQLDVSMIEAAQNIVPLAVTASESVERLN